LINSLQSGYNVIFPLKTIIIKQKQKERKMTTHKHSFPKLHNAAWPGVVGKGGPDSEPCIDFDAMLDLTAAAEVDGIKFDGFDLFLYDPHFNIDGTDDDIKQLADKAGSRNLVVGSVVAPIWGGTGGGSAFGDTADREKFLGQVKKGCHVAARLRELGVRPYGGVRVDSSGSVDDWAKDPAGIKSCSSKPSGRLATLRRISTK